MGVTERKDMCACLQLTNINLGKEKKLITYRLNLQHQINLFLRF